MKKKIPTHCLACHKPLEQPARGRKRKYCNDICRLAGFRHAEAEKWSQVLFDCFWREIYRRYQLQYFDKDTCEALKHIAWHGTEEAVEAAIWAIRHEIKAREEARPKRKRSSAAAPVEATVIYPEESPSFLIEDQGFTREEL